MSDFDPWHSMSAAADVWTARFDDEAAVLQRQRQRLASLLNGARRQTRLHAERLRGIADDAPLASLPRLSKQTLMARFEDSVADDGITLAGLRAFVAAPGGIGSAFLGRYTVWESSGSSGEPGLFVQDAMAMAVYDALEALRRPRPCGPDPFGLGTWGQRQCFVGAIEGHFASEVSLQRLRRLNPWLALSLRSFSIMQALPALVEQLNRWNPSVVATYPTAAVMLAAEQCHGSLDLRLREVLTGGEMLAPAQRAHIEAAFGCPVRNSYGASEFLAMASECAHGQLHLNADWVILEPVDRRGRPVPRGTLSHTTLLTNLANAVQPLIRYDIGDRIRVAAAPCACGSALPVIEVHGRNDDALLMQGAGNRRVTLLPLALCTALEETAGVFDFQIRQLDPRTLSLQLGPHDGQHGGGRRCHAVLQSFARSQGVRGLRIVDRPAGVLPKGRSGKLQRIVACDQTGGSTP
jgi:phenylacetate-coenzyme A ligase PaaK-like adenylate-forming protein